MGIVSKVVRVCRWQRYAAVRVGRQCWHSVIVGMAQAWDGMGMGKGMTWAWGGQGQGDGDDTGLEMAWRWE